jgi:mono/diheme cytochrome c family protein
VLASIRDASTVAVLDGAKSVHVERTIDVPTEPIGLALSPDDATLVVASGWGRRVSVLDTRDFAKRAEHVVGREPRGVVVAKDGKQAFVSHAVGKTIDVVPLGVVGPAKALDVSGQEETVARHGFLSTQSRAACQGFALAMSDSGRVLAPQALVFTGDPSEQSSGYGGGEGREAELFHVAVLDEDAAKVVPGTNVLRAGSGGDSAKCALPRAARAGKAGLFVTCLGEDAVTLVDARAANPQDVELARWSVPAGPVGLALDETHARAVVWSQFAHALTTIAIGEGEDVPKPVALTSTTIPRSIRLSAKIERGRALFHATNDKRISEDGRACASCHPDGRDDTLVWSSPNGPRQTPILAGRLDGAAPYGWNGDAKDVPTHLTSTFKRLGGKGIAGDDKEALVAYVTSMRPPPAKKGSDAAAIARGAKLFQSSETECSSCHGAAGDLPDGSAHDVKSRTAGDIRTKFDTPSLRFVSGSAPYFHDGRYADLPTLLAKSDGKMGHTKQLSPTEIADLAAYLESL